MPAQNDSLYRLSDDLERVQRFLQDKQPAYAVLLDQLKQELRGEFVRLLASAWGKRKFFAWYDRPLLLLASLRYDALAEGLAHPLWSVIGEGAACADPSPTDLRASLSEDRVRLWDALTRRAVQTNETTRAVAWLWTASLIAHIDVRTPLHIADVGTSAGLNLIADELQMVWTDQYGEPLDLRVLPPIATRLGLDLTPLDVRVPDAARWLHACVWPSDRERLEQLDRAIATFRDAMQREAGAPRLEICPIEAVAARLESVGQNERLLVLQTIVRDYLSAEQRQDYEHALSQLIAARPRATTLWVELEVEQRDDAPERSAVIRVHVADRNRHVQVLDIARTHPHPRQLFIAREHKHALLGLLRSSRA